MNENIFWINQYLSNSRCNSHKIWTHFRMQSTFFPYYNNNETLWFNDEFPNSNPNLFKTTPTLSPLSSTSQHNIIEPWPKETPSGVVRNWICLRSPKKHYAYILRAPTDLQLSWGNGVFTMFFSLLTSNIYNILWRVLYECFWLYPYIPGDWIFS